MRTSMEKVKPEWNYFCMSWKNDQRKSYFKETLLYITQQGWFEIAFDCVNAEWRSIYFEKL